MGLPGRDRLNRSVEFLNLVRSRRRREERPVLRVRAGPGVCRLLRDERSLSGVEVGNDVAHEDIGDVRVGRGHEGCAGVLCDISLLIRRRHVIWRIRANGRGDDLPESESVFFNNVLRHRDLGSSRDSYALQFLGNGCVCCASS